MKLSPLPLQHQFIFTDNYLRLALPTLLWGAPWLNFGQVGRR